MGQPIIYCCLLLLSKITENTVFPLFSTTITIIVSPFLRIYYFYRKAENSSVFGFFLFSKIKNGAKMGQLFSFCFFCAK